MLDLEFWIKSQADAGGMGEFYRKFTFICQPLGYDERLD
jgi:hypothetical protein